MLFRVQSAAVFGIKAYPISALVEDPFYRVLRDLSRFPALRQFANPYQCGYYGDTLHDCTCTPPLIQRYIARVSGPLLDRIDLHIQVPAVKYKELAQDEKSQVSIDESHPNHRGIKNETRGHG